MSTLALGESMTLGEFSGGQPFSGKSFHFGSMLSDLCVPLGLGMPDTISFLVENDRETNAEMVPSIGDEKFDDLFFRISYRSRKKNKTRKKRSI